MAGFVLSLSGIIYAPLYSLGFIAGVGKEVYDSTGRGCVELADVLYTWLGASVAVLVGLVLA